MHFAVLGPLLLSGVEARYQLAGRKERAVLAILLARRGTVVPAEELVDALWGQSPPASAGRSLEAHVSRVRSATDESGLRRAGSGWVLDVAPADVDSGRFELIVGRARHAANRGEWIEARGLVDRARGLLRGRPFDGFLDIAPCAAEGERLAGLAVVLDELEMECRLAVGGGGELVDRLRELADQDPFRENRWAMLMTALFRAGRQAEALDAYGTARTLLRDELGVDPSGLLQLRHQQVLEQDPALLAPLRYAEGATPDAPYRGLEAYRGDDAAVFMGRERMVATVLARLGDAGIVTVAGVSGSGKSSLVLGGVLPALRAGALPGSDEWDVVVVTPGTAGSAGFRAGIDLVVVDQAEELFSQTDEPARKAFAEALGKAAADGARLLITIRADHWAACATVPALMELVGDSSLLLAPMSDEELRRVVLEPARRFGVVVDQQVVEQVLGDVAGRDGCLPLVSTALARAWRHKDGDRLTMTDYRAAGGVSDAVGDLAEEVFLSLDLSLRQTAREMLLRLVTDSETGLARARVPVAELVGAVDGGEVVLARLAEGRLVVVGWQGTEVIHESLFTAWPRLARWLEEDAAGRRLRAHLTPAASEWVRRGRPAEDLYRGARLAEALDWRGVVLSDGEREFLAESERHADIERTTALDRADRESAAARRLRVLLAAVMAMLLVAAVVAVVAVRARQLAAQAETEAVAGRLGSEALLEPRADRSLLLARQAMALHDGPAARSALFGALLRQPRLVAVTDLDDRAMAVRLTPDGRHIASCTIHGELTLRGLSDLEETQNLVPAGGNFCGPLAFLDGGEAVATVRQRESLGADLEIRSVADGRVEASLSLDDGWYTFAAPDSSAIVVGSTLGGYLITRSGGAWSSHSLGADVTVSNIVGNRFAMSRPGNPVSLRRTSDGRVLQRLPATRGLYARALTADGELAVTSGDNEVRLLDAETGQVRLVIPAPGPHEDVFFAAGDRLLVTTNTDGQASVWERRTGRLIATVGAGNGGLRADVTPDGSTLVSLADDGTLATWDLTGERTFGAEKKVPFDITAATYDALGSYLVGTADGRVVRLDADDLRPLDEVEVGGRVLDLEPTDNGDMLVIADDVVTRLDPARGLTIESRLPVQGVSDAAWQPGAGLALVTGRGRAVTILREGSEIRIPLTRNAPASGSVVHEYWGHLEWSPDGTLVAASLNDGSVHVLDREGEPVAVIPPSDPGPSPALGVAFLDDDTLVVGDRRGRITPFDPRTGTSQGASMLAASGTAFRPVHAGNLVAVGSSGDGVGLADIGQHVLYGNDLLPGGTERMVPVLADDLSLTVFSATGTARRWPGSVREWADRACRLAGRSLSRDEWTVHLGDRPYDPAC